MTYTPRTSSENPFCPNQKPTDEAAIHRSERPIFTRDGSLKFNGNKVATTSRGMCQRCRKFVPVRKNGTPKLHRVFDRSEAAKNAHAAKKYDDEAAADRVAWWAAR